MDWMGVPGYVRRRLTCVLVTGMGEVRQEALVRSPFQEPSRPKACRRRLSRPAPPALT